MLLDMAQDFAKNELEPNAAEWDRDHHFPTETLRAMADLGFGGASCCHACFLCVLVESGANTGMFVRADVGGSELSRADGSVLVEALSHGCTSTTAYLVLRNTQRLARLYPTNKHCTVCADHPQHGRGDDRQVRVGRAKTQTLTATGVHAGDIASVRSAVDLWLLFRSNTLVFVFSTSRHTA